MKISLENYLKDKIDELESMHSFEIATDTIRCWIDDYNKQLQQTDVIVQSEQLKTCEHNFADIYDRTGTHIVGKKCLNNCGL